MSRKALKITLSIKMLTSKYFQQNGEKTSIISTNKKSNIQKMCELKICFYLLTMPTYANKGLHKGTFLQSGDSISKASIPP